MRALVLAAAMALAFGGPAGAQSGIEGQLIGEWVGTYRCLQGETGIRLTFQRGDGGGLTSEFRFFSVPNNPQVPSGTFILLVDIGPDGLVTGRPSYWVAHPDDYIMVGYEGRVDPSGATFTGRILHETCSTLDTSRVGPAVAAPTMPSRGDVEERPDSSSPVPRSGSGW